MAITPIDLQTLFTQLDKVGKTQASQKEGLALQQSIQGVQLQKKANEHIQQINEAQNTGEGAEKVNDHSGGSGQKQKSDGKKKEQKNENKNEEKDNVSVLDDPSLGKNIDISF
jgi:ribosomal protein L12E/L44/L45/RPP1/RPP2